MALEGRLELKLQQKLILTPQLQMAIKLLQMPQLELSQTLTQELVENPFLEEASESASAEETSPQERESEDAQPAIDDTEAPLERMMVFSNDDYFEERGLDGRDLGYFHPDQEEQPSFEQYVGSTTDLFDHLLWQLRMSRETEEIRRVGELIIGNIDENGYFRGTIEEIAETAQTDTVTVESALRMIQSFDPPGIGARDIIECLQLQLKLLNLQGTLMENLVLHDLDLIGKKKYAQLAKQYNMQLEEVMQAVKIIEGLDPKPGANFASSAVNYVTPDVYIVKNDGVYQIILNDEGLPKLRINSYYYRLLSQKNTIAKEDRQFLEEKLASAKWLMKSLDQRNKTIYRVTESILNFQREFFDTGASVIKPLNLRDIATQLGLHESTISRVTSNKYLSCPHGIYGFRFFFSNAITSEAGDVSSTSVKDMIKKIISEEDTTKPLSDMRIVDIFKTQNITIARRTIAKYREELKIPAQSQRRR